MRTAQAHLKIAGIVLQERGRDEYPNVAASLAILAGIAASGAICGLRLGRIHRGDDHRGAQDLLQEATPDGPKLAANLGRLLSLKDAAHYGVLVVAPGKASEALRWASHLVERATEEAER
jgi:hypothetical protein